MPKESQLQQIEAIYKSAPIGLCVLDRDLRYVSINDRLAEINGVPALDHLGRSVREVLPGVANLVEPLLRRVLDSGHAATDVEIEAGQRTVLCQCLPLRSDEGEVIGINIVVEEITERKRVEQALREADRVKDDFLAFLAHELRAPLAPILTAARMLELAMPREPALQKACSIILRQSTHLTRLVDDLLDVGRIRAGKLRLQKRHVELNTILAQAVETCAPLIKERRHTLDVSMTEVPVLLDADDSRVVQVVCNLLNNAAKYMKEGGIIHLSASEEDGAAVIRVRDHGVGIPPEMLGRIFNPFVQVDPTRPRAEGGLGIGLSVVRSVVELHGGSVEARSDGPGQGAEFTVRLPVVADAVRS